MGAVVSSHGSSSTNLRRTPAVGASAKSVAGLPANGNLQLRFSCHDLAPGVGLENGVGAVTIPPANTLPDDAPPRPACDSSEKNAIFAWFVEDQDRPGQWKPYNKESVERLEQAFLSRHTTCLVALKNRTFTIDLNQMIQLPTSTATAPSMVGARRVKRSLADLLIDSKSGVISYSERRVASADPFAEDDDSVELGGGDPSPGALDGDDPAASPTKAQSGGLGVEKCREASFPRLVSTVIAQTQSIFSMALCSSTAVSNGSDTSSGGSEVMVVSGSRDKTLRRWSVDTGKVSVDYVTGAPASIALNIAFAPNYKHFITGFDDSVARVYRTHAKQPVCELRGHTGKVYGVGITCDGATAVTGSMDMHVRLWDMNQYACVHSNACHSSHIFSLALSKQDPNLAISVGDDNIVCVHDFRLPNFVANRLSGHTATLWDCDIRCGDDQYASCGMDGTVRLWDARDTSKPVHIISSHTKPVHCVQYTTRGAGVLSCSKDRHLYLTNTSTGKAVWRATAARCTVFKVCYLSERQMIVTSSADGTVQAWHWPAGDFW